MRRLVAWFLVAALVPTVGLALLGWRMSAQDRELERDRRRVERERAVELAASRLQQIVAELDAQLVQVASGNAPSALADGVAAVVIARGGLVAHLGDALPYYPALPIDSGATPEAVAAADALEFRARDYAGAERTLRPLLAAEDDHVRAAALMRLARLALRQGRRDEALARWRDLEHASDARIDRWPAPLRAAQARALLFAADGATPSLHSEARGILDRLARGIWPITREQYEVSATQARAWLNDEPGLVSALDDKVALADALARAAEDVPDSNEGNSARQVLTSGSRSVLVLWHAAPEGIAALAAGPAFVERAWRQPLTALHRPAAITFGLSDASGRVSLGPPVSAELDHQSSRPPAATGLPWTVHAVSTAAAAPMPPLSAPTRLMLVAVSVMTGVVLAASFVIARAMAREVEVARLQADFVAAVSHEFRTPLTTLRHLSELLLAGRVSAARREAVYATLFRDSQRLQRLVEGLLNVGRLESGRLDYRNDALDLAELVRRTAVEFEREAAEKGYRVVLQCPGRAGADTGRSRTARARALEPAR
jgi:signal transduction histidine kinase